MRNGKIEFVSEGAIDGAGLLRGAGDKICGNICEIETTGKGRQASARGKELIIPMGAAQEPPHLLVLPPSMAAVLHPQLLPSLAPSSAIQRQQRQPRGGILLNSPKSTSSPLSYSPIQSLSLPYSSTTPSSPRPQPQMLKPYSASSSVDGSHTQSSASAASTPPPSVTSPAHHANSLPAALSLKHVMPAPDLNRIRSGSAPPNGRRIRFAPLPDPRRAVLITDDGDELPLPPGSDDDDDEPNMITHSRRESDAENPHVVYSHAPDCFVYANGSFLTSGAPDSRCTCRPAITTTSPSPTHQTFSTTSLTSAPSSPTQKRSHSPYRPDANTSNTSISTAHTSRTKKLFKPFLLPKLSHEDSGNLSSLGLFRTSSKESTHSNASTSSNWSMSLSRWTSDLSGSHPGRRGSFSSNKSAPGKGSNKAKANSAPSSPRKTTRMLNGRVYGAPRHPNHLKPGPFQHQNKNAFANVRDEAEFVEWGYGGAGSVRNSGVGGKWSKLQSGDRVVVGKHDEERGRTGAPAEDEDDGSGMSWARKRREAREKAKKEQEERERQQKAEEEAAARGEAAATEAEVPAPTPSYADEVSTSPDVEQATLPVEAASPPPPTTSSPADSPELPEHVHTAVTIPAPGFKHSRTLSSDAALKTPTTLSREPTMEAVQVLSANNLSVEDTSDEKTASEVDVVDAITSSGTNTSASTSEDEDVEADEKDDEDEDDDQVNSISILSFSLPSSIPDWFAYFSFIGGTPQDCSRCRSRNLRSAQGIKRRPLKPFPRAFFG